MKKKVRGRAKEQFPTLEYAATQGWWKAIETYTFAALSTETGGLKPAKKETAYLYSYWIRSSVMNGNRNAVMKFLQENSLDEICSNIHQVPEYVPLCYALAFMYFYWADMYKAEELLNLLQGSLLDEKLQQYRVLTTLLRANIYRDKGELVLSSEYLSTALHLAEQLGDDGLLSMVYQQMINYQLLMGEHEKIERNLQHAIRYAALTDSDFMCAGINITNAYYNIHKGEVAYSIELLQKAINVYERLEYPNGLAGAYHAMGIAKASLGILHEAIEALLRAEGFFHVINDRHGIMFVYTNISHLYSHAQQYRLALEYAEKSYAMSLELKLNSRVIDYAILLSTISARLRDIVSAEQWLYEAEQLVDVHGHIVQKVQTVLAKTTILCEQKKFQEGRAVCLEMLQQSELSPMMSFELWCFIIECSIELKDSSTAEYWFTQAKGHYSPTMLSPMLKGRFMTLQAKHALYCTKNMDLAENILLQIVDLYKSEAYLQLLAPIQRMLLELYEKTQRWEKAVHIARELITLKESVTSEQGRIQLDFMLKEIELKNIRQQLLNEQSRVEHLQSETTRQSNQIYMLSAELVEKQQVLLKAIRTISEVKDSAHSDIGEKVHSLHTELQQSVTATPEQQSVADSLRHIDDNLAYALLKICPQLTPMELKICSLLKLQLTTKQVAGLLHTSVRNIENHRYRIRKKLFLQTEEHLPTFFARIAHLWHDKK